MGSAGIPPGKASHGDRPTLRLCLFLRSRHLGLEMHGLEAPLCRFYERLHQVSIDTLQPHLIRGFKGHPGLDDLHLPVLGELT